MFEPNFDCILPIMFALYIFFSIDYNVNDNKSWSILFLMAFSQAFRFVRLVCKIIVSMIKINVLSKTLILCCWVKFLIFQYNCLVIDAFVFNATFSTFVLFLGGEFLIDEGSINTESPTYYRKTDNPSQIHSLSI